jgi:colanic acid/amylovoran biosynthesis glycosyltransferase
MSMSPSEPRLVGYVVSRYPRFSETFIVNEILGHERAGLRIEIFALRPPIDTHFQDLISRVRAPANYLYLPGEGLTAEQLTAGLLKADIFWNLLRESSNLLPGLWSALESARDEEMRDIYQAVMLAREVRRKGISHLHAHFAGRPATVARLAARLARIPYTFTAHANDIFNVSVRPDDLGRKLSDAAAVVTVSDFNVYYLRRSFGHAAAKVQRIYCGLDLNRFPYESPQDRPARIVSVGRLVEKKGFEDLIEACAILAKRNRCFSCQIIGTGALEASLRAQIERLGLQSIVELTGPRPQVEVIECVKRAAALVLSCVVSQDGDRDGLPTVLLEAMALGIPCVSTDVTGIPEVVRDGETGLMVPQRDPTALATAMERLLADSGLRVRLASAARRVIEADFDIDRSAALLRGVFRKAAQERGSLPRTDSLMRTSPEPIEKAVS